MKVIIKNTGYFFKEIKTLIKLDFISNLFSIISLGFIFFLLSLIVAGGWSINHMMNAIENEAEISVYYFENSDMDSLKRDIEEIPGVREVKFIDENEAKKRMTEIMGEESRILELFDHNPFSPYIEVMIQLDYMDTMVEEIKDINGVELVRDNKSVLENLRNISNLISVLGILIIVAVSVATLVITSHLIRQGIYANREQINTLRLLGAPEGFITLPFILEGLFMSLLAAIIAVGFLSLTISYINSKIVGSLPFLVLPDYNQMILGIGLFSLVLSIILGLLGCLLGLKSTKNIKG